MDRRRASSGTSSDEVDKRRQVRQSTRPPLGDIVRSALALASGLLILGLGVFFLGQGLDQADKLASVLGAFASLAGTAIAAFTFRISKKSLESAHEPAAPATRTESSARIYHNLPTTQSLIGRKAAKDELASALGSGEQLIVVEGTAGIGKTTLTLGTVTELMAKDTGPLTEDGPAFDAYVWVTAKAKKLTLDDLLNVITRTLDYPYIQQLDLTNKGHQITELLRTTKTLLIVDNYETVHDLQVTKFIEEVPAPSKVVLTTRHQHPWHCPHRSIQLSRMSSKEALGLIVDEARRQGVRSMTDTSRESMLELCDAAGGSPLAINGPLAR